MTNKETPLGLLNKEQELEIRDFKRIKCVKETAIGLIDGTAGPVLMEAKEVPLDAWTGKTVGGHAVHVSYRLGELTIEVNLPTQPGCSKAVTALRWKPRLALGRTAPVCDGVKNEGGSSREENARLDQVSAEHAEISAVNGKPRNVSEREVRGWLEKRNQRLPLLSEMGLAGGNLRIRIADPESDTAAAA